MNSRIDSIGFDLKESVEDLLHEIKTIQETVEDLKKRVELLERGAKNNDTNSGEDKK